MKLQEASHILLSIILFYFSGFFCRFFLFIADTHAMRQVFNNKDDAFRLQLTLTGPTLMGKDKNIAYMNGAPHKALRKMLLPLFTRQALGVYLSIQEKIIRKHISQWLEKSRTNDEYLQMRPLIRDLNVETSYQVGGCVCGGGGVFHAASNCSVL